MMVFRKAAMVLALSSVAALAVPVAASAATTPASTHATSLKSIPVTGTAHNGKAFKGKLTVTQFATKAGHTVAVGILTGRLGNRKIKPTVVSVPAKVGQAAAGSVRTAAVTPAACPVLNLILGPLHLNLLGLNVDLNQVILNITAQSGAGNLLGNLLCGVSNLLNTQSVLGGQLTGLLNIVQQLTGTPALLGL